ncbi:MAG: alpha/beta hydrolase [Clostridia bacterium]|nr:alpha/beta hydrolase [Clostridia bacterium]
MQAYTVDLYEYFGLPRGTAKGGMLNCFVRGKGNGVISRPAMLVLPGGGYRNCSDREAEPIALRFMQQGFHAFVLTYSVAPESTYPTPFLEASLAVAYIRRNAESLGINQGQIAAVGFSAGGHLLGLISNAFQHTPAKELLGEDGLYFRPDASIYSYPVITANPEHAHKDSFFALVGENAEMQNFVSIENRVNKDSAPAFIWHTVADGLVPVENSLILASALQKAGVPFALHVFTSGPHGLSLCDEETVCGMPDYINPVASKWVSLAEAWLKELGFARKTV